KQHTGKPESTLETSVNQDTGVGGIHQSLETQEVLEVTSSHLANPNFTSNSMEIKSAQENPFLFSTINQTVEELNTNKESVIAIFVPAKNSKPSVNSFISAQKETTEVEDIDVKDSLYKDVDYGTEEHLWQKVSKLHSKITLLEFKEQQTLGRLKSLEALIRQLKQENWLSEENVKIIENRFTTYEVTII
uniref:THAP domain containing 5 n=1 Tax=Gorilla gorilla gorilla TaxID=9595 RepID=A0A2I2Z9V4_GORGO